MIKPYYETKLGKLYHGDCLEIMPELEPVDLVVTDPPYNVNIKYDSIKDTLTQPEYDAQIKQIKNCAKTTDWVILLGSKTETLLTWWLNFPTAKQVIVRVGASVNTVLGGFRPQYRSVLTTKKSEKWWSDLWEDIRFPGEGYFFSEKRYNHPCHAPVRLITKIMGCLVGEDDIIMDPFMGIGTTAAGCEEYNKRWIGIEISERYCEIAAKRIEQETKQMKLF